MRKDAVVESAVYLCSVALASLLWRFPWFLALSFLLLSAFVLHRWHDRSDLASYLIGFVMGSTGEAVAVYFGAWQYSKALFLVPIWLPFLWGIAALFMKRLTATVVRWI
jgi:hypothetical protein